MKTVFYCKRLCAAALALAFAFSLGSCGKGGAGDSDSGTPSDNGTADSGCKHSYSTETVAATCVEEGKTTYTCTLCGDAYTETVAATGHTYVESKVAPTATKYGYTLHECHCGAFYKDNYVDPLDTSEEDWSDGNVDDDGWL